MKKFSATLTMMMLIQSALIGSGSVSAFAPVSKSNHVTNESPSPIVLFESKVNMIVSVDVEHIYASLYKLIICFGCFYDKFYNLDF